MNVLEKVRSGEDGVLVVGSHPQIVQSMLDFDHLCGKTRPSVVAIVAGSRTAQKFFFGSHERLIPCARSFDALPAEGKGRVRWMLNVQSGRRAYESTRAFFDYFPRALGGHIFAEHVPESHATELIARFGDTRLIAGPSGVGIFVSGALKLGAVGGTDAEQIDAGKLTTRGSVAVVSTSGGMTNELIRAVAAVGKRVSFSVSIGGDRFPITSLTDVLALAEADPETRAIAYFGELGGTDEYEIVELLRERKLTKPIVCYIAGAIDEAFDGHMQFGHAKALVAHRDESARAKREALARAGAIAPDTFPQFLAELKELPLEPIHDTVIDVQSLMSRRPSILSTRKIVDLESVPPLVKGRALAKPRGYAFASAVLKALLGRECSQATAALVEYIFELLIDHGGHVSGAVNTMIAARAGKDMVSSLASGLLTIGPRFGGAVNEAARTWYEGVRSGEPAAAFVEARTKRAAPLAGIGHRKYRIGLPDPRVAALAEFATLLKTHPHYDFARAVEKVTTSKNGKLILNVDGAVAALLLDVFAEKEKMTDTQLAALIESEFFNALFIIPRTVGFIGHFLEQKTHDEGLFRLPDELLFERDEKDERRAD